MFLIELKSRTINIVFDFSLNQGSFVSRFKAEKFCLGGRVVKLIYIQDTHTCTHTHTYTFLFNKLYICAQKKKKKNLCFKLYSKMSKKVSVELMKFSKT